MYGNGVEIQRWTQYKACDGSDRIYSKISVWDYIKENHSIITKLMAFASFIDPTP